MKKINVKVLEKEIVPAVKSAEKIEIKDDKDMKVAVETLSGLNKYFDKVTEEKEKITKPLNAALKSARLLFKPLEDQLESAIGMIRKEMTGYQTIKVEKERKEAAKIADKVSEGKMSLDKAVSKLEDMESAPREVVTEEGSVTFRAVKKFRVVDISKVPVAYVQVNDVEVRRAMNAGIPVAGVEYYEEQVPYNSR